MALFGGKKNTKKEKSSETKSATKLTEDKKGEVSMQDLYNAPTTPRNKVSKVKSSKTADVKVVDQGASLKINSLNTAYRVLLKPVITEKATHLNAINKYVFVVGIKANKISVAQAVEAVYGVKPVKVNIINVSGKRVISKGIKGKRKDWRKAIVSLKKGESIKIYEGV